MEIRPYHPNDEPALISLEQLSPRGFPTPFVHFRRHFFDRARLYPQAYMVVAEDQGQVIGVSTVVMKELYLEGQWVTAAYSFDSRVHPKYRQHGVATAMIQEKLAWAEDQGAVGVYSLIVATNQASLAMVEKQGYHKARLLMYLQYQPSPLLMPLQTQPLCYREPVDADVIHATYQHHDLYLPHMSDTVQQFDYQRWCIDDARLGYAGLSVYNQAKIYVQIPAEAPYPRTEQEINRLGNTWQIFDVVGLHQPEVLYHLFEYLRDEAVMQNVNKLLWVIDRQEMVPEFVFQEAIHQMDYWLMYKSFNGHSPNWTQQVYLDPRDI